MLQVSVSSHTLCNAGEGFDDVFQSYELLLLFVQLHHVQDEQASAEARPVGLQEEDVLLWLLLLLLHPTASQEGIGEQGGLTRGHHHLTRAE